MDPTRFTWGVIEIMDIGPRYTIISYVDEKGHESRGTTMYHVYVDGDDTRVGCGSLNAALIWAIARANVANQNEARWMGNAAAKLLEVSGL